jgi:hypothetical protein
MQSPVLKTQNASSESGKGNHTLARRLIVLVPSDKFDEQALSMRIRAMLKARQSVLWLALASDLEGDYKMRHCLKYLAAVISSLQVKSEYKLVYYDNWLDAIQSVWMNGDRIVCLDGHMVRGLLFTQKSLAQRLAANNAFSIDVIQGVDLQKPGLFRGFWSEVLEWALSIGIIVLFFFIQVYIFQNTSEILGKVFIFISILVEFWLIAKFGTGR